MHIEKHAVPDVVYEVLLHECPLPPLFCYFPVVIPLSGIEVLQLLAPIYTYIGKNGTTLVIFVTRTESPEAQSETVVEVRNIAMNISNS